MSGPASRPTFLEGLLAGSSVLATALLLELARNLVVNSFSESAALQVLGSTLRWLSVLIVAVSVVYAGYQFLSGRREQAGLARRLAPLAELEELGLPVEEVAPRPLAPDAEAAPDLGRHWIAATLRELPVAEFDTATLLAVLTAILDAPTLLPLEVPPRGRSRPRTATVLLEELVDARILSRCGAQRYRLARAPEEPGRAEVVADKRWQAALPALLRHCADRACGWAVALDSAPYAESARRWFTVEEPYLCQLVKKCAERDNLGSREQNASHPPGPETEPPARVPVSVAAAAELVRISDALDSWYARTGRPENENRLAESLQTIRSLDALVLSRDLAKLRAGLLRERPRRYRPRKLSTGLAARWEHRKAVELLAGTSDHVAEAVAGLESAWSLLPREDIAGEACVLINLAGTHIRQGRLDAARDRLELAEVRTRGGRDPGGRAQVHELTGVLWWVRGEPRRALRSWQRALTCYRNLADDLGTARCLRHLGSAIVLAPEHGDLLLGTDPPPDTDEVLRRARGWLVEAQRRRPDASHTDVLVEGDRRVRALRRHRSNRLVVPDGYRAVPSPLFRWPLPAPDRPVEDPS